jgi:hypothetical protein
LPKPENPYMHTRDLAGLPAARRWFFICAAFCIALLLPRTTRAQSNVLLFDLSSPGVTKGITNWGMSAGGGATYRAGIMDLRHMGTNTVNFAQVRFDASEPLTNNDLAPMQKWNVATSKVLASMATAASNRWILGFDNTADVASWYRSGEGTVYPERWAALMAAWQRNYNQMFWIAQPFNEPDSGGQGSQQNLFDIIGYLQGSNDFTETAFGGGSTFDCDQASSWYNFIASRAAVGTTHATRGSVASYVSFIESVLAQGGISDEYRGPWPR